MNPPKIRESPSLRDTDKTGNWSGIALRLFFTCWIVYALHFATNTVREIYPALALADHGSFDVREYEGLHPDIFPMGDGRCFINNNPGASILAAVPYALAKPVVDRVVGRVLTSRQASGAEPPPYDSPWPMAREFHRQAFERGLDVKFGLAAGVMQAGLMAPLSAASVVVMFVLLRGAIGSASSALWLALLYAFATPVFFRTGQLNQNLIVTHCALMSFALLWRPWDPPDASRRPAYFLAGLLGGWAVVCDYSGLILPAALGVYGLIRRASLPPTARSAGDAPRFLAGVLLSGLVLLGYQWVCFGHPLYPAQHYMPAANFTERGYVGFDVPRLDLLWDTAFSLQFGLFTSAPLLILAAVLPAWLGKWSVLPRREVCFALVFVALYFLFCAANQYGRMQFNTGVRHVVPVTPFVFLLAVPALRAMPSWLAGLVAVGGTYWSWCLAMFRDVESPLGVLQPLLQITLGGFRLPWLTTLERMPALLPGALGRGVSTLPLLLLTAAAIYIIWRVPARVSRIAAN